MARKAKPKRTATAKRTSTRSSRRKKKPEVEVAAIGTAEETPSGSWSLGGLLKVAVGSFLLLVTARSKRPKRAVEKGESAGAAWPPQRRSSLRIVAALLFLQYGLSKYFGYPAKPPANFSMLSLLGLAGAIELVGSLLLLVGLWSRWAAFIMSGEIAVAYFMRRAPNGFFPQVNGGGRQVWLWFLFVFV